jgi:hypothetical protein
LFTAQVPPLFASVTVATCPEPLAVAEQFVNPLVSETVGEAGTVKPAANVAEIVEPAKRAPLPLVVNPIG